MTDAPGAVKRHALALRGARARGAGMSRKLHEPGRASIFSGNFRDHHGAAFEGPVNGALACDFGQLSGQFGGDATFNPDGPFEAVDIAIAALGAFGAVAGMHSLVVDRDGDRPKFEALAVGIHAQRHGGTCTERDGQKIVGRRS